MTTSRGSRWAGVGLGLLATVAGLLLLGASDVTWVGHTPATCAPDHCFNEAVRAGAIKQPANTWSNLGFVTMGLLLLTGLVGGGRTTPQDARPPLQRTDVRVAYGACVVLLGWTSMYFHASLTFPGEWLDLLSMMSFTSLVVIANLGRVTGASRRAMSLAFVLTNVACGGAMLLTWRAALPLFVGLSSLILVSDALVRRRSTSTIERVWLGAAVVCCLTSFAIWVLDRLGLLGSPVSWFQGHAAWHVGQAGTTGLLYRYYASEEPAAPAQPTGEAAAPLVLALAAGGTS